MQFPLRYVTWLSTTEVWYWLRELTRRTLTMTKDTAVHFRIREKMLGHGLLFYRVLSFDFPQPLSDTPYSIVVAADSERDHCYLRSGLASLY